MIAQRTKRVLVVDDDLSIRDALVRHFAKSGCVVEVAADYSTAENLIDHQEYTLIVCDNNMPIVGETRPRANQGLRLLARSYYSAPNAQTSFVLHTDDESQKTKDNVDEFKGHYLHKGDTLAAKYALFEKLLNKK